MRIKLKIVVLICSLFFFKEAWSQAQLVVSLNSGNTEIFLLEEIRSMRFIYDDMVIHLNDGFDYVFGIEEIEQYYFTGIVSTESLSNGQNSQVRVYPNPSTGITTVSLLLSDASFVKIDLLDTRGKQVQSVFEGNHQGLKNYPLELHVPEGLYLVRVTTRKEVISQVILVQ